MSCHRPQHLLLTLTALPLITSQPLYEQYNLKPRTLPPPPQNSLHHRLLQEINDYEFNFDITTSSCSSPLITWSMEHIRSMGYDTYKELYDNKILEMPYTYKHYIDKNEDQESFGYDGSATEELIKRHADTMRFWTEADVDNTITTEGILLLSMHGSDLLDNEKLVPTIIYLFDFEDENDILSFATTVQQYILDLPSGENNPLLTMNAVATRGGSRKYQTIPTLIIGDGVLQFIHDSNLSTSGPDFIHAHEFGHHLQYEMDMVHNIPHGYENDIRRKELMADAISAYFLAHDKGGDMDAHEISEFSMTAFATGDCNVGQDDHHGMPKQRYCASVWGASRAALVSGSVMIDPESFVEMFNGAYDGIMRLDVETCTLILEEEEEDYAPVSEVESEMNDVIEDEHDVTEYEPETGNVESVESKSPDVSLPESVEEAFNSEEDYETTDGTPESTSETAEYPVYETTIEPPHETIYTPVSEEQTESHEIPKGNVTENELPDTTIWNEHLPPESTNEATPNHENNQSSELPHENSYTQGLPPVEMPNPEGRGHASSKVEEATHNAKEALVVVSGHPSESQLQELSDDDRKYACSLPWVYCDENSSVGRESSVMLDMVLVASVFALMF